MLLRRFLALAAIHFGLWYALAQVAYGSDLDRLPDRSALATGAASLCAVLQYPNDLLVRLFPVPLLRQAPQLALVPLALNSVLWGIMLSLLWQLLSATRRSKASARAQRSRLT